MNADAHLQTFRREMDVLRAHARVPTAAEIARMAMRAKLSLPEALLQIQLNTEFRARGSMTSSMALPLL